MVIEPGKVVAIYYVLKVNGVVRYMRSPMLGDPPLEYLHGAGQLVPGLEQALAGRHIGERFTVMVPPELGYGERKRSLQQRVPLAELRQLGPIDAGMVLQAETEDGRRETLVVTEIDEENGIAILDANHPLAGQTLEFEVHVVDLHDPTPEELHELTRGPAHRPIRHRPDPEAALAQLVQQPASVQPSPVVPPPVPKTRSDGKKRRQLPVFQAREVRLFEQQRVQEQTRRTPAQSTRPVQPSRPKRLALPMFQPGSTPVELLTSPEGLPGRTDMSSNSGVMDRQATTDKT